jgi:hypothetical protein
MSAATNINDILSPAEVQAHQAAQWGTVTKTYRMTKAPVQIRRIAQLGVGSFAAGMLFVTMCQGFAQSAKADFKPQPAAATAPATAPVVAQGK